jgi:hypothetical protein
MFTWVHLYQWGDAIDVKGDADTKRSQQTRVAPRVGLHSNALFLGGHLTPGPTGSTPPNVGISFENWAGASKQKLLLAVGLQSKILFLRVHLTPGPTGFTHSQGGICSSLFRSLETCPSRSC